MGDVCLMKTLMTSDFLGKMTLANPHCCPSNCGRTIWPCPMTTWYLILISPCLKAGLVSVPQEIRASNFQGIVELTELASLV